MKQICIPITGWDTHLVQQEHCFLRVQRLPPTIHVAKVTPEFTLWRKQYSEEWKYFQEMGNISIIVETATFGKDTGLTGHQLVGKYIKHTSHGQVVQI